VQQRTQQQQVHCRGEAERGAEEADARVEDEEEKEDGNADEWEVVSE